MRTRAVGILPLYSTRIRQAQMQVFGDVLELGPRKRFRRELRMGLGVYQ